MNLKQIMEFDFRNLFRPSLWLVIVFIPHTLFNVLIPLTQQGVDSEYYTSASYGFLNSVVLFAIFMFSEGKSQARLTAVISGAVFIWMIAVMALDPSNDFAISAELTPPFIYKISFDFDLAPPLILWALLTLSGLLNWNHQPAATDNVEKVNLDI